MSVRNIIILITVLVVLVIGGYFVYKQTKLQPSVNTISNNDNPTDSTTFSPTDAASPSAQTNNLVTIGTAGFTPDTITIKMGDTVNWINSDTVVRNVSSDPHPSHTNYPPLNLGAIQAGASKSLMFDKVGTYTYHDHLHPSFKGTIIVQ